MTKQQAIEKLVRFARSGAMRKQGTTLWQAAYLQHLLLEASDLSEYEKMEEAKRLDRERAAYFGIDECEERGEGKKNHVPNLR